MKRHKPLSTNPANSVIVTDPIDSRATLLFLLSATKFAVKMGETRI